MDINKYACESLQWNHPETKVNFVILFIVVICNIKELTVKSLGISGEE